MKSAILIAPLFFHYEDHIKAELERNGYKVYFIHNRINRIVSFFASFFSIERQRVLEENILLKRIAKVSVRLDLLLVIKGESFTKKHLDYIKQRSPNIKAVMYQWDSVRNFQYLDVAKNFDKIYTFDFKDSKTYNINYLPLFYTDDIKEVSNNMDRVKEDIDFMLVGTFNPLRYKYYLRLKGIAEQNNLTFYSFILVPFSYYIKNQILHNTLHIEHLSDIKFCPMNRRRLLDIYMRSKVVVDVCRADQTGLSMRMIESYGFNKKVITANKNVSEDKYVGEILNLNTEADDKAIVSFFEEATPVYQNKEKLSIRNWLNELLDERK